MHLLAPLAVALSVLVGPAAPETLESAPPQRKPLDQVSVDLMGDETQVSAEPTDGINLVWFVPYEYWAASAYGNTDLSREQSDQFLKGLEGHLIVAIVRGTVGDGGFRFFDRETVAQGLVIEYRPQGGNPVTLKQTEGNEATKQVLKAMAPMLAEGMGEMGRNFHFFVYDDRTADGKRLASPYERGSLRATLAPLPGEQGGRPELLFPLTSLFAERRCGKCERRQEMSWNFCPWDGTAIDAPAKR